MNFKKKVLPIVFCFVIVVIAAVVGIILWGKNSGHRVIKVDKVSGEAGLERDEVWQEIYENINLKSQDAVITGQDGQVELLVDSDKHILARENTKFNVVSSGTEKKGKMRIELQYGTSLVEIENKLPKDAIFEVETPNATIGVRGTVFETSYDEKENKTVVVVTSGVVEVVSDTESATVEAGQSVEVVDDDIELVSFDMDDTDSNDSNDSNDSEIVEGYVENENLPIMYSLSEIAFELGYNDTAAYTGISVKSLKDFTPEIEEPSMEYHLDKGDLRIEYVVYDKADAEIYSDTILGIPEYLNTYVIELAVNQEGDHVKVMKYSVVGEGTLIYSYLKKISDNMYLLVAVCDATGGEIIGNDTTDTYLPLTLSCYYNYADDVILNTEMDIPIEPYYNE